MKDRLIEILKNEKDAIIDLDLKRLADALIEAGVILPRFNEGQEAYIVSDNKIYISTVARVNCEYNLQATFEQKLINKHYCNGNFEEYELYATKEEAEKALKEEL